MIPVFPLTKFKFTDLHPLISNLKFQSQILNFKSPDSNFQLPTTSTPP
jgi:hypothetical protein